MGDDGKTVPYYPVLDGTSAEATDPGRDPNSPMPVDVCSFLGNEDPVLGEEFDTAAAQPDPLCYKLDDTTLLILL